MADNDPDRAGADGTDQDFTDPDRTSGSCDTWHFRVHEGKRLDQNRRYETGILEKSMEKSTRDTVGGSVSCIYIFSVNDYNVV